MKKGCDLESWHSRCEHSLSGQLPLLVHPKFLRLFQAGQVDLAYFDFERGEKRLNLVEIKSGHGVSRQQIRRLKMSAELLGHLFTCPVSLSYREGRSRDKIIL